MADMHVPNFLLANSRVGQPANNNPLLNINITQKICTLFLFITKVIKNNFFFGHGIHFCIFSRPDRPCNGIDATPNPSPRGKKEKKKKIARAGRGDCSDTEPFCIFFHHTIVHLKKNNSA